MATRLAPLDVHVFAAQSFVPAVTSWYTIKSNTKLAHRANVDTLIDARYDDRSRSHERFPKPQIRGHLARPLVAANKLAIYAVEVDDFEFGRNLDDRYDANSDMVKRYLKDVFGARPIPAGVSLNFVVGGCDANSHYARLLASGFRQAMEHAFGECVSVNPNVDDPKNGSWQ